MNILVLDDSEDRLKFFRRKLGMHRLDIFSDPLQALATLRDPEKQYNLFFLDHDLGKNVMTGDQFLQNPLMRPRVKNTLVVIHSLNPDGAKRMLDTALRLGAQAARIPFTNLKNVIALLAKQE